MMDRLKDMGLTPYNENAGRKEDRLKEAIMGQEGYHALKRKQTVVSQDKK